MKLIKINTDHYIIVDDSQINKGDYCLMFDDSGNIFLGNEPQQYLGEKAGHYLNKGLRKITHSTQPIEQYYGATDGTIPFVYHKIIELPLSEVKELLGEVDVEKNMWYERNVQNPYPSDSPSHTGFKKGFEYGYNQALEDNKEKKYTEKDLLDAFAWGFMEGTERGDVTDSLNKFSQSLQPKTEWEVEIVDGKLKLK